MPDGLGDLEWSPDGRWIAFTSRTRDERYEAEDVSWQAPRKVERFFSRLNGEDWIFDRPQHIYVVAADSTGTPRNLTPGAYQHNGITWLPDSSGIVTSSQRHETWDRDLATDLYLVPLDGDGEIRALTKHTGQYSSPSVSPGWPARRVSGRRRPGHVSAEHEGRRDQHRRWRTPMDQHRARPHVRADRGLSASRLDRRRFPVRAGRGSWRHASVPPPSRRPRPRTDHVRRDHGARVRRRGRRGRLREGDRRAAGRDPHARRSGHRDHQALPRLGEVRRAVRRRLRRDRRVDHAAGRLRPVEVLPGAAQRPRRAVHAVRRDVLRRGADAGGRRVRGADVEPAGWERSSHRVGAVDPRTEAPPRPRHRAGVRSTWRTCSPSSTRRSSATRSAMPIGSG